jgi:tRNA-dihydrouridine synthase B
MDLYFAPLKGLTDAHFRSFYFKHFFGFDYAIAPFLISTGDGEIKSQRDKQEGVPELIPQLLGNRTDKIIRFTRILEDNHFSNFNLNLGCPAPVVIKKNKGAALLSEPDYLYNLLKELSEDSPLPFSIKTRLGYNNRQELLPQLKKWKNLEIRDLIIHARSARQVYKGETDWVRFKECAQLWEKPIIYNGDIRSPQDYQRLTDVMGESLKGVMLGRGIFSNPFIAEEIKKGTILDEKEKGERFLAFHRDISEEMNRRPKSFARLKGLWSYFSDFAHMSKEELETLKRYSDPERFCREAETYVIKGYGL